MMPDPRLCSNLLCGMPPPWPGVPKKCLNIGSLKSCGISLRTFLLDLMLTMLGDAFLTIGA